MDTILEKIAEVRKEIDKLSTMIYDNYERLGDIVNELRDNLSQKKEEVLDKLAYVNNEAGNLRSNLVEKSDSAKKRLRSALTVLDDLSSTFLKVLGLLFAGAIISFILLNFMVETGVGIPFSDILPLAKDFSPVTLHWIFLLILVTIVIMLTYRSFNKRIEERKRSIFQSIEELEGVRSEVGSKKLEMEVEYSDTNKIFQSLAFSWKKIISGIKEFVPLVSEYSECKVTQYKQRLFVDSLYNCLFDAGIHINQESKRIMEGFGSLSGEDEWIEEISESLARELMLSPEIIQLMYYEYAGKAEQLKNLWSRVKENEETVEELASIVAKHKLQSPDAETIVIRILQSQEIFDSRDLETTFYSIVVGFQKLKGLMLTSMNSYNLNVSDEVSDFLPESLDEGNWENELSGQIARSSRINQSLVQLIFYEFTGEHGRRLRIWNRVRKDEKLLSEFARILITNKLLPHHGYYGKSDKYDEFISGCLAAKEDFILIDFRRELIDKLQRLDETKNTFFQSLRSFKLELPESLRREFSLFLPQNIGFALTELISLASKFLAVDEDVLQLFFFTYMNDDVKRKMIFSQVKDRGKSLGLADVLVNKAVVITEGVGKGLSENVRQVNEILLSIDDFQVSQVQRLFERYNQIISESNGLCRYLHDLILIREIQLTFPNIIRILSDKEELDFYEQMKVICLDILEKELLIEHELSDKERMETALACLSLYFHSNRSVYTRDACQESSTGDISSKILYQYVNELGERKLEEKERISLRSVVTGVLERRYAEYKYLNDFREKLSTGYLYTNISELLRARFEDIEKSVIKEKARLQDILKKCKKAVRDFLNAELKPDFLVESLNSQIISAFMITTTSSKAVLRPIIDNTMPKICDELSKSNPIYKDFLILAEETPSTAGRYTRVGLVPISMSFEEFNERFNGIFEKAVIENIEDERGAGEYSVNLIRIFPSDLAFKLVKAGAREGEIEEEHPVFVIRQLCIDKLGLVENLELVASSISKESRRIVLRRVIEGLFNQRTTLLLLTENIIFDLVKNRQTLRRKMENGEFDLSLMGEMGCSSLSELAVRIHRRQSATSEETAISDLKANVGTLLKSYRVRMDETDMDTFTNAVFETLKEIGLVLEGLE